MDWLCPQHDYGFRIEGPDFESIAWVGASYSSKTGRAPFEANARFIAASPEMYAALLMANASKDPDEYCACPEYHWDPMDDSHTGFCNAARVALAKAKGE